MADIGAAEAVLHVLQEGGAPTPAGTYWQYTAYHWSTTVTVYDVAVVCTCACTQPLRLMFG